MDPVYIIDKELWLNAMKEADVIPLNTNVRDTGKIIHLDTEVGYGFIQSDSMKFTRVYFHWSQLDPSINFLELNRGDKMEFDCSRFVDKETKEFKGYRAYNVKKV